MFIKHKSEKFLKLFNEIGKYALKFIKILHSCLQKVWNVCIEKCYNYDYIRLDIELWFTKIYSSKYSIYLSPTYDVLRSQHDNLNFLKQYIRVILKHSVIVPRIF